MTIIFCAKELMKITKGTQTLEEVDVREWKKHDNTTMMPICSMIDEKPMNVSFAKLIETTYQPQETQTYVELIIGLQQQKKRAFHEG